MPIVNRRRGCSRASSANTPAAMPGVSSLEDRPYRPPVTRGSTARSPPVYASVSAAATSRKSGSPLEPGSLVRSSTATRRTLAGSASSSSRAGNGRYSRTWSTPTRSPRPNRWATVSPIVCAAEPITTITRSACG